MRCFVCLLNPQTQLDAMCDDCRQSSFDHVDAALTQAARKGSSRIIDDRGLVWEVRGDGYILSRGQGRQRWLDATEARCFEFRPLIK